MVFRATRFSTAIVIIILLQLFQAATTFEFGEQPSYKYNEDSTSNSDKVMHMDLHPASSYIRWLHQQLELLDAKIEAEAAAAETADSSQGENRNNKYGGNSNSRKGGSLRHLEEIPQLIPHSNSNSINHDSTLLSQQERIHEHEHEHEELRDQRRLMQQQLENAINHLQGTNAAYASVIEFSSSTYPDINENNGGSRRLHLHSQQQQSSRKLKSHNDGIQEYNTHYRRYSKYEWAVREGREEDYNNVVVDNGNDDESDRKMQLDDTTDSSNSIISLPLVGTTWKAVEIGFSNIPDNSNNNITTNNNNTTTQSQFSSILPDNPITLSFDDDTGRISGNAGCNRYHGASTITPEENSFNTSFVGATRMYCRAEGVMEQERSYIDFLTGRKFFFEVIIIPAILTDADSEEEEKEQLVLYDAVSRSKGHLVQGDIVARFIPLSEPNPRSSGEKRRASVGDDLITTLQSSESSSITEQISELQEPAPTSNGVKNGNRILQQTGRAKKKGGMFNSYQTSPLHQGYGTHYATIWVGTPAQRKSVIIDTGSHFTAFPCKGCVNCGEEHHTDKYFDPEASTTFRALGCSDCHAAQCQNDRCVFSQTYTEGSSWHAYESIDKVFVGAKQLSSALNPINNSFKTDFLFGCQMKETGLFVTQLADGIMGMSAHPSTLPRAMYDQGKLDHNMFSMCFRRELHVSKQGIVAGMLTLGGIDSRKDFAPMVYARNVATTGWFTVFVKNVYIRDKGGQSAKADGPFQKSEKIQVDLYQMNSGKGVIVDSGTTDTYLHESIARPFELVWQRVTGGRTYSNEPVKMDKKDLLLLPTILIQMAAYDDVPRPLKDQIEKIPGLAGDIDPTSPQDIILAIPATHYMEYSPSKGTYTPRIYFTESRGGVIGANAMQGHNVLFDWENKRVGFAESSCEFQEEHLAVTEEGVMSVDCKLGAPALSVSCSDSADLSRCDEGGGNADAALQGLEIWTRVVQAPGFPNGKTCEQVAVAQNEENGGGQVEINCDGKGVCREVRKCVISCANAIAHGAAGGENAGLSPIGSCGAETWSACDYSCTQTKVDSVLMNDGKCHEEKSLEETRECHVQACGRSDPCRVPFVVHAIMKIRGAIASHWTKHSEEIFSDAFTATMNERRQKELLFFPGDVVILNASPWRASDDTIFGANSIEDEDEELGMQLVIEISIFNPNAELPPTNSGKQVPLATCHERDFQTLANIALNVHKKLAQSNVVDLVIERMKKNKALGEKQASPFYYTFEDRKLAQMSQVVTSWTIKTDVGVGSARIDFNSFTTGVLPMDYFLLALLSVITAYTCWSLRLWPLSKHRSGGERGRGKYSRVGTNGHYSGDDDTAMAIADDRSHDGRSVVTDNSDLSAISERGESAGSLGSLSTYLAKTSERLPKGYL